jgi:hypothetical protein
MQPTKIDNRQEDIFKSRLSNELNPKHETMILSRLIPWDSLEVEFADLYQVRVQLWRSASKANPLDDWNSFAATSA